LLLRVDAVETVELVAGPVEANERCTVDDEAIGFLLFGPRCAPEVPTCVRAYKPSLVDFTPLSVTPIPAHIS
jgi:hypothetical protein